LSLRYMQSSVWPVSIYHTTSTRIQKELGELFDAELSHLREGFLWAKVRQHQLHHPWIKRHSINSQPCPAAISLLDWTPTKAMMALSWRLACQHGPSKSLLW
jgi:hypothetical protein